MLKGWRDVEALKLLNLVYDLTRLHFVTMVVTEVGNIPATSWAVIQRVLQRARRHRGIASVYIALLVYHTHWVTHGVTCCPLSSFPLRCASSNSAATRDHSSSITGLAVERLTASCC